MVLVSSAEALVAGVQGFSSRKERKTYSTSCGFCDGHLGAMSGLITPGWNQGNRGSKVAAISVLKLATMQMTV